ncbi:MAG: cell division protein FtsZ [Hyphomonadaceae bacterium]|nr:cell division protein FtsZ [Hyphomonadaceae bacterium]
MQASKYADLKPRIVVIGVGGGGGNAVNNMLATGLTGVTFIVANTDAQALSVSGAEHRIQLGARLTEGIGAGAKPEIGEAAAEEALEEIRAALAGAHMVFIAAGMGGGTGTGAASVIARVAKEFGILTVAVVTKPFTFEGKRRMRVAEAGISELKRHVDTLLVIPNQNLFKVANDRTPFTEAFVLADRVLYSGVACIVDLVVKEGLINLDLADVKSVLSGMGTAMMGTGEASGEQRAVDAARAAVVNPLLDDVTLRGAKSLLLSISGGSDLTLFEVHDAVDYVREQLDSEANIIFGATLDEGLVGRIRMSIVASGMARAQPDALAAQGRPAPAADAHAGRDFRDRLSEAIDYSHPDAPAAQSHPRRDIWQAPGDVVIREGRAGANDSAYAHQAEERVHTSSRGSMPAVEDFPPHAQREYWAKAGDAGRPVDKLSPMYPQHASAPARRPGLLQRLTGGGRERHAEAHRADRSSAHAANGTTPRAVEERVDLPVFFGRNKRS